MEELFKGIRISVDEAIYVKDPYSSELGKLIVGRGVGMMLELGLESFTFRKLAEAIDTTEGAIYRYFENKHKMLLYFSSWYWGWMEYRLMFTISNVEDPTTKLDRTLELLLGTVAIPGHEVFDIGALRMLMVEEAGKVLMTKDVNEEYGRGFYVHFQRFVKRVSDILLEINAGYTHPNSLAITLIDAVVHQQYYRRHLPFLSDIKEDTIGNEFFRTFITKTLSP